LVFSFAGFAAFFFFCAFALMIGAACHISPLINGYLFHLSIASLNSLFFFFQFGKRSNNLTPSFGLGTINIKQFGNYFLFSVMDETNRIFLMASFTKMPHSIS
jgi:hypothetical protein